jgi:hypothetical protein
MTNRSLDDVGRDLTRNAELLESVRGDLRRCPDWKKGTRWHDDRCRARQDLLRQRDELQAERLQLCAV